MSESRNSDTFIHNKAVPVLILITGLVLLWIGSLEFQQFTAEVESYVSARPENRTVWLIILGTATSVAGAIGLLRKRTL